MRSRRGAPASTRSTARCFASAARTPLARAASRLPSAAGALRIGLVAGNGTQVVERVEQVVRERG